MDNWQNYTTRILEGAQFAVGAKSPVDRDKGIIRHCKILGLKSPNSHNVAGATSTEYDLNALRKAKHLYEGIPVKWNHRPRNKPFNEDEDADAKLGVFRNIVVESDGMYGDFHYNRSHPKIPRILEDAERPDLGMYSFSHDADGRGPVVNGVFRVTHIPEARSVDIVYRGATNKTLFESHRRGGAMPKTLTSVLQESWLRPDLSMVRKRWISHLLESPHMTTKVKVREAEYPMGEMPVDAPPDANSSGEPEDMLKGGFEQALHALATSALNGEIDEAAACKKFKDFLKHYLAVSGTDEPAEPADSPDEPDAKAMEESLKRKAKEAEADAATQKLNRYEAVERLLESTKRRDVPGSVKTALLAMETDDERRALLNEMTRIENRPRSTSPHNAPAPPGTRVETTEAAYAERYRKLFKRDPKSVTIQEAKK